MTIHKSQGSEFDHVVLSLPTVRSRILTNELVYTGITRARKVLHVAGSAEVMDEALCGKADLYLCGHDHNRQWPQGTCGNPATHFIVSGAGSKTTDFEYHGGGNPVYWEDDTTPGFLLLELTSTEIHTAPASRQRSVTRWTNSARATVSVLLMFFFLSLTLLI